MNRIEVKQARYHSRLLCVVGLLLTAFSWAQAEPRDAEEIVARNCLGCHTSGAGGAPRPQHLGDWQALFSRYSEQQVVDHAYEGRGRMPARGFCNDCSRDDIARAIEVMLPESMRGRIVGE